MRLALNSGIGVDFHGRVHRPMAKVLAKELEQFKLMFIEEPVLSENREALREIANHCSTPIALGERLYSRWDFKSVLSDGFVDIIQRIFPCGGITECRKIAAMARPTTWLWRRTALSGPIALAACLQVDAVSYNAFNPGAEPRHPLQRGGTTSSTTSPTRRSSLTKTASFPIPQGPGLGIEVDEAYVIERAKEGHRWRNPIWRHADGSVAEW
ncbi:hypothetical protein F2981_18410 (plasmid) [Sinorhizobium meliloti]|nr:hypothetical protein [Sinorhizobium meliloti]